MRAITFTVPSTVYYQRPQSPIATLTAATAGFQFENVTTTVLLVVLIVILLYHFLAFSMRAYEEYRLWEFQLASKEVTYMGGGVP